MKTLLIPTDFSETSQAAIDFGLELAEQQGYQVILHHSVDFMHTYEAMYMDVANVRSFTDEVMDDCETRLENLFRKCRNDKVDVKKKLTNGGMIQDIRKVVEEEEVDLIVMGTRGASGLKEFLVGSNTEKVVRLVDCPVISVPGRFKPGGIRRIMVPVDLREIRGSFLREISKFQQLFSASVEFVWVKTPHELENVELVSEEFNNLLSEYEVASSSFTVLRKVFPDDALLDYAKESKADMIAMATHARRGVAHFFSGSMTEDVMNHANVPLWSLKIDENEEPLELEEFQSLKAQ